MGSKIKIDPRTRLFIVIPLTTLAIIFNNIVSQSLLLLAAVLLCLIFGKAGMNIFFRAKWLPGFFILMAILQSVFNPDERTLLVVKGVTLISVGGIELGACFLCRMMVIIFSAGIIVEAGNRAMIQGLVALRLPYELAFMTTSALSFLPMIAADMKNSLTALQLRGVELGKLSPAGKVKVYGYLIIPVLEGIVIKAKELSCAMEMRAFRSYNTRTSYIILSMKTVDYVIIGLTLTGFLLSLLLYLR